MCRTVRVKTIRRHTGYRLWVTKHWQCGAITQNWIDGSEFRHRWQHLKFWWRRVSGKA